MFVVADVGYMFVIGCCCCSWLLSLFHVVDLIRLVCAPLCAIRTTPSDEGLTQVKDKQVKLRLQRAIISNSLCLKQKYKPYIQKYK